MTVRDSLGGLKRVARHGCSDLAAALTDPVIYETRELRLYVFPRERVCYVPSIEATGVYPC